MDTPTLLITREIKFRGWNTKLKYMIQPEYGNFICFDGTPYEEADQKYDTPHMEIEKSKGIILLQYTGLKDKYGKDIYEGDIIKAEQYNPPFMQIEFIEGGFCMTWGKDCDMPIDIAHFYHSKGPDFEVIDNIYENSDLLEE